MTEKLKGLVNKLALEYILTKDEAILKKVEREYAVPCADEEAQSERDHKYGAIVFYKMFHAILKKKDKKYFNNLSREIEEKGGDAEVDIDYLERIIPPLKSLNFVMGFYNKQYGLDEKEIIEFEASVQTGRSKPHTIKETGILLPYNLRMKKSND